MYFIVEDNQLKPAPRGVNIDTNEYKVQIDSQRYQVSANDQHTKFLVDFGLHIERRSTIICEDPGQMIIALGIVRTAFPNKQT